VTKRSLFIITPTFAGGGAEHIAVSLANYYVSINYTVYVICELVEGPFASQLGSSVIVRETKTRSLIKNIFSLKKLIFEEQPEICISTVRRSNVIAGFASYFTFKKHKFISLEVNTLDTFYKRSFHSRLLWKMMMQISYRKFQKIVACSEVVKTQVMKLLWLNDSQITVIGNPVLPQNYLSLAKEDAEFWPIEFKNSHDVFISLGRFEEQKNYEFMIRGFAELVKTKPNSRLLILGNGSQERTLNKTIVDLGLTEKIKLLPFQRNPYAYLKRADIFLMSSRWEGFGNVFIMASALGLPIISSNAPGGPKEIINDQRIGTLYPVDDTEAMLDCCENLLLDDYNTKDLKKFRQISAEKFSIEKIAKTYLL
jgi:glycosyltransferase involved in cell wall biosynthesis